MTEIKGKLDVWSKIPLNQVGHMQLSASLVDWGMRGGPGSDGKR